MGRYTHLYDATSLAGPGDDRPTAHQIMLDENRLSSQGDTSLAGKVAIVTGCTSGIGPEIAKALLESGMEIWVAGRGGKSRLHVALSEVGVECDANPQLHFLDMNLASLSSVRAAATKFLEDSKARLNILINNAAVMASPQRLRTEDGLDLQFGTNHVGHFLFFCLVRDALLASSTPEFHSRVVNTSSSGHRMGSVRFDDLDFSKRPDEYATGFPAYGQSKTANIWMANSIERLYGEKGLHAWSVMPGGIHTPLQRHLAETNPKFMEVLTTEAIRKWMRSPAQGAAAVVWSAVARELEGEGGKYCENCEIIGPAPEERRDIDYGYAPWAYDSKGEERLWKVSCEIVGMSEK